MRVHFFMPSVPDKKQGAPKRSLAISLVISQPYREGV